MKAATEILRQEHEAILRMLEVTDEVSRRIENGTPVRPEVFADLVEFFRLFADSCHHGKEERLLFPAMEGKGSARQGGPIGVMLMEHDHGRTHVQEMAAAAEGMAAGAGGSSRRWVLAARGYSEMLRSHIQKENNVLFVMAEQSLSEAEQSRLAEAFEKLEEEIMGPGTHDRLHGVMQQLVDEILA